MSRARIPLSLLLLPLLAGVIACGGGRHVVRVGNEVEPGVVYLGDRRVSFAVERDTVDVGRYEGRFSAIQIQVTGAPLEMFDMRVLFGNGEVWSPATRLFFREGEWTRRIDLPGDNRVIRRVEFVYTTASPRDGHARVQVFGVR